MASPLSEQDDEDTDPPICTLELDEEQLPFGFASQLDLLELLTELSWSESDSSVSSFTSLSVSAPD